jgi:uncharacterized protein (DUF433 family)
MTIDSTTTNPYLEYGTDHSASDMRVRSGYPVWNLIGDWITAGYSDADVIQNYRLDEAEWAAAKDYYLAHKAVIDARLIMNQEPTDEEIEPGITTPEDFFAWSLRGDGEKAQGE